MKNFTVILGLLFIAFSLPFIIKPIFYWKGIKHRLWFNDNSNPNKKWLRNVRLSFSFFTFAGLILIGIGLFII